MKKTVVLGCALVVMSATWAVAPKQPQKQPLTDAERSARRAAFYAKTGGMVRRPNTGSGKIAIVNAQKKFADGVFAPITEKLGKRMMMDIVVSHADKIDLAGAAAALKASGAAAGVFVTELGATLPPLIAVPDGKYALVNISAFPADAGESLVRKEALRALAMAAGAMGSQYPGSLMEGFDNLKKLAAFPIEELPADVMMRMRNRLKLEGVVPYQVTTYRLACRDGWAHQPTNQVEKAIWDEVHALPTEPIKIKPETKRVEK